MAVITIGLNHVCAGLNHVHLDAAVDGGASRRFVFEIDDLRDPITSEEMQAAIRVILRIHALGKTKAQFRNSVQAGLSVPI